MLPVPAARLAEELAAAGLGSGWKATWIVNAGPPEQVPLPALVPMLAAFVELSRVTSLTPSIRRRRPSVSATVAWLVAQPERVNAGMLPGGVAELTELDAPAAPGVTVAPTGADAGPGVGAGAGTAALTGSLEAATVPLSEVIDTPLGSTRPNSWKA